MLAAHGDESVATKIVDMLAVRGAGSVVLHRQKEKGLSDTAYMAEKKKQAFIFKDTQLINLNLLNLNLKLKRVKFLLYPPMLKQNKI